MLSPGSKRMFLAILCFSLTHLCVRELKGLPIVEIIFFRAVISFTLCSLYIRNRNISFRGGNNVLLFLRGLFGVSSLALFFYTVHHIPLGSAVTLTNLKPFLLIFLAALIFKETLKPVQVLFFLIAFSGVFLLRGFDPDISLADTGIAMGGVLLSSAAHLILKKLKESDRPVVILLYFSGVTLLVSTPFAIANWHSPTLYQFFLLASLGVLTHVAQLLMTQAYHMEKMANVTYFSYLSVVFALVFGFIFYGETYSPLAGLGMLLILGGVFLNVLFQAGAIQRFFHSVKKKFLPAHLFR